jgi:hypothetical protein
MGAAGHNVAMSLIRGEALRDPKEGRPRTDRSLKDLVMNDTRLDRVRYRVARNRLARPLVSALTRRR